jgi:NAD+ synthase (glutamine-hydrolysing)
VEFRKNPEWVLEMYQQGKLEFEMKLEPGKLAEIFNTEEEFRFDLEKNYQSFISSYFKRIQAPPIPKLSKRAFGYDLRESMLSPIFTDSYRQLVK